MKRLINPIDRINWAKGVIELDPYRCFPVILLHCKSYSHVYANAARNAAAASAMATLLWSMRFAIEKKPCIMPL